MRPEGPCRGCSFWEEGCRLIRDGRTGELLDAGACRPWRWVPDWIDRFLRCHHANAVPQREDLLQDLQLHLRQPSFRFPADLTPDAHHLRPYLRSVVLNRASDFLRKERVVPKVRCGACLYRGRKGRCTCAVTAGEGAGEVRHPHLDEPVDAGANPLTLEPPCREFFWRYRPLSVEDLGERRKAAAAPARDLADEEVADLLTAALAALMRAGPSGRRRALVLREHFLAGRTATAIADSLGLNERTVRRNLQAGLEALRVILREKIGVTEEDLL
jgi:RNA polymerase sigma factor (sigma-70 family)